MEDALGYWGAVWGLLRRFLVEITVGGVMFHIATYALSMIAGLGLVYLTPEGVTLTSRFAEGLYMPFLFILSVPAFEGLSVGLLFPFIWAVFLVCLAIGWLGPRESAPTVVRRSLTRPMRMLLNNCLFALPILTGMLLMAQSLINTLQESVGVSSGSLNIPDQFYLFFLVSYAAIFEEVGFRLIPLGVFVAAYALWRGRAKLCRAPPRKWLKVLLLSFLYPEGAKDEAGLRTVRSSGWVRGLCWAEWSMILVTALAFGLAHIFSGAGWGLGKFTTTFLGGGFLAWVYLAYGLHAPILMHWFFNYHLTVLTMFIGLPVPGFDNLATVTYVTFVGFGVYGWLALGVILSEKVARWRGVVGRRLSDLGKPF